MDDFVSQRLKDLCISSNKSYYQLARESGISTSNLYSILHGKTSPTVETLHSLCKPFGIELKDFFSESVMEKKEKESISEFERKIKHLTPCNQKILEEILEIIIKYQTD